MPLNKTYATITATEVDRQELAAFSSRRHACHITQQLPWALTCGTILCDAISSLADIAIAFGTKQKNALLNC